MHLPVTTTEAVLAMLIIIGGATLQGTIGFGMSLVTVAMLAMVDADFVPVPLLVNAVLLNIMVTGSERESFSPRTALWPIVGRLIGAVLTVILLTKLPKDQMQIFFGVMVLLAVLLIKSGWHIPENPRNLLAAGTLSGVMGTAVAIGAPPLALALDQRDPARFRSTISGICLVGAFISFVCLAVGGAVTTRKLMMALILLPGMLVGFAISRRAKRFVSADRLRPAIILIAGVSSIVLIILGIRN
jgi:uncharacterized membrane protein YfcA